MPTDEERSQGKLRARKYHKRKRNKRSNGDARFHLHLKKETSSFDQFGLPATSGEAYSISG